MWFLLHNHPTLQYFLHPDKKLLPAIMISLHMDKKQSWHSLKSLKENTLSLWTNGWGRKVYKNSVRYLKASITFTVCVINAMINMLTEQFDCDEKILMLSLSIVCLSSTVLNALENKKGIIKILVYSSIVIIGVWLSSYM